MTLTGIRCRTKSINTFIFANRRTTMRIGLFIALVALAFAGLTAETILTIFGTSRLTNAA